MANFDAYDIQRMPLLLAMKNNINYHLELQDLTLTRLHLAQQLIQFGTIQVSTNLDLEQLTRVSGSLSRVKARIGELEKSIIHQTHAAERIESSYMYHLGGAPLLEDAESADIAKRRLRDTCGWTGSLGQRVWIGHLIPWFELTLFNILLVCRIVFFGGQLQEMWSLSDLV